MFIPPLGDEHKEIRIIDLSQDELSVLKTYKITRRNDADPITLTQEKEEELVNLVSKRIKLSTKNKIHSYITLNLKSIQ